jgi:hypothetical protein
MVAGRFNSDNADGKSKGLPNFGFGHTKELNHKETGHLGEKKEPKLDKPGQIIFSHLEDSETSSLKVSRKFKHSFDGAKLSDTKKAIENQIGKPGSSGFDFERMKRLCDSHAQNTKVEVEKWRKLHENDALGVTTSLVHGVVIKGLAEPLIDIGGKTVNLLRTDKVGEKSRQDAGQFISNTSNYFATRGIDGIAKDTQEKGQAFWKVYSTDFQKGSASKKAEMIGEAGTFVATFWIPGGAAVKGFKGMQMTSSAVKGTETIAKISKIGKAAELTAEGTKIASVSSKIHTLDLIGKTSSITKAPILAACKNMSRVGKAETLAGKATIKLIVNERKAEQAAQVLAKVESVGQKMIFGSGVSRKIDAVVASSTKLPKAVKSLEVASTAEKTGKAGEVASTAGKVGKAGEAASTAGKVGKAGEAASSTGKVGKAGEVASTAGKVGKAGEAASSTGKTSKVGKVAAAGKTGAAGIAEADQIASAAKTIAESIKAAKPVEEIGAIAKAEKTVVEATKGSELLAATSTVAKSVENVSQASKLVQFVEKVNVLEAAKGVKLASSFALGTATTYKTVKVFTETDKKKPIEATANSAQFTREHSPKEQRPIQETLPVKETILPSSKNTEHRDFLPNIDDKQLSVLELQQHGLWKIEKILTDNQFFSNTTQLAEAQRSNLAARVDNLGAQSIASLFRSADVNVQNSIERLYQSMSLVKDLTSMALASQWNNREFQNTIGRVVFAQAMADQGAQNLERALASAQNALDYMPKLNIDGSEKKNFFDNQIALTKLTDMSAGKPLEKLAQNAIDIAAQGNTSNTANLSSANTKTTELKLPQLLQTIIRKLDVRSQNDYMISKYLIDDAKKNNLPQFARSAPWSSDLPFVAAFSPPSKAEENKEVIYAQRKTSFKPVSNDIPRVTSPNLAFVDRKKNYSSMIERDIATDSIAIKRNQTLFKEPGLINFLANAGTANSPQSLYANIEQEQGANPLVSASTSNNQTSGGINLDPGSLYGGHNTKVAAKQNNKQQSTQE